MARQTLHLAPPPPKKRLVDFPEFVLEPETELSRVHHVRREPWWFSSSLEGRFDLEAPHGTCYLAFDALGALLETLPAPLLNHVYLEDRRVATLQVDRPHRLAHLMDGRAAGFGVTGEISTLVPYAPCHAWATAFHQAGFDGVLYRLRHDPRGTYGVALFGKAGHRAADPETDASQPALDYLDQLRRSCGLVLFHPPPARDLRLV